MNPQLARPVRRLMGFVDGENLVARYQALVAQEGRVPKSETAHERDVYVWHHAFTLPAHRSYEILRVTYYTSAVGDDARLTDLRRAIRTLTFDKHYGSTLPTNLCATVIKRQPNARGTKGVDIQLCVEALTHVLRGNVDAILLMTGDGDYIPLIDEVRRAGVQVFLGAFSSGLNPLLLERVDAFIDLDSASLELGLVV